ncbi:MAG: hypothetical protein DGJ47_000430 [Rickettsiaceae bacterium]
MSNNNFNTLALLVGLSLVLTGIPSALIYNSTFSQSEKNDKLSELEAAITDNDHIKFKELLQKEKEWYKWIIGKGGSYLTQDDLNDLLIHTAREKLTADSQISFIKLLVEENEASINAVDEFGWAALHYAARAGQIEVVKFLVKECDVNPSIRTNYGSTVLHLAARNGHIDTIKFLVKECNIDSDIVDKDGYTAIYHAINNCTAAGDKEKIISLFSKPTEKTDEERIIDTISSDLSNDGAELTGDGSNSDAEDPA